MRSKSVEWFIKTITKKNNKVIMKIKSALLVVFLLSVVSGRLFSQDTLGNCNCWTPLDLYDTIFKITPLTEGTALEDKGVPPNYYNDNGSTLPIKLPFSFCFYGKNYDTVYINNNGNISFKKPLNNVVQHLPPFGADTLMLAPFFADIYTWGGNKLVGGDRVFYQLTPTYMVVKWNKVGFYSPGDMDEFNSIQLTITNGTDPILPAGNNVQFCYNNMMWATTSDTTGFGGFPAMVGISNGNKTDFAQFGTFRLPGTQYLSTTSNYNGLGWLINKSFSFNTCTTSHVIPPVMINDHACDTISICANDSLEFATSFISQPAQVTKLSVSSPGLTGVSVKGTTSAGGLSSITVRVQPSLVDVGTHVLQVTATDNSSPALLNTRSVTVTVNGCGVGIDKLKEDNLFIVYPNPASDKFTIELLSSKFLKDTEVQIVDLLGTVVYSSNINNIKTDIDLSLKPKGIYFLSIYRNNIPVGMEKIILK
jgi:hypothetical protein